MSSVALVDRKKGIEALSNCIDDRGVALAWVWGEAGIGKTFLLRYFEGISCGHPLPATSDLPRPDTGYICTYVEGMTEKPISPQSAVLEILDQFAERVPGFAIQREKCLESPQPISLRVLNNIFIQNLRLIAEALASQAASGEMVTSPQRIVMLFDDFEYVGQDLAWWLYSLVARPKRPFREMECLLIISGRRRMGSFGANWRSLEQDWGIRRIHVGPFQNQNVEELRIQIDPDNESALSLSELCRKSEGVPELIRLLLESGRGLRSSEEYARRVFRWPEDSRRRSIVQACAIPRFLDYQVMAQVVSVVSEVEAGVSADGQLDWLKNRDDLIVARLHGGEERWSLRPWLRLFFAKRLYSVRGDLYRRLHNSLLTYYTSKLAEYHPPDAFGRRDWQLLKREQVFHNLAVNPGVGLSLLFELFIQCQELKFARRIELGQALFDILDEVAEIQNNEVLRSWVERLRDYYTAPNEAVDERFQDHRIAASKATERLDHHAKIRETEKDLLRAICENRRLCSDPSSPNYGYGELPSELRIKAFKYLEDTWDDAGEESFEDFIENLLEGDPDDAEAKLAKRVAEEHTQPIVLVSRDRVDVVCILHISDIHRHTNSPVSNGSLWNRLNDDIKSYAKTNAQSRTDEPLPASPDLVVVSGDLTKQSTPEEYQLAHEFLKQMLVLVDGDPGRVVLVPGNHDVNWDISKEGYSEVTQNEFDAQPQFTQPFRQTVKKERDKPEYWRKDEDLYPQRFRYFKAFFDQFYAPLDNPYIYSLQRDRMYTVYDFSELYRLVIVGLNSCDETDHLDRRAFINTDALDNASDEPAFHLGEPSLLRMAVFHHNIRSVQHGEDFLEPSILRILMQKEFHLCLHGHVHDTSNDAFRDLRQGELPIVGAGSLAAHYTERQPAAPKGYNLLTIDCSAGCIVVHTRRQDERSTIWEPDYRWNGKCYYEIPLHSALVNRE